MFEVHIYVTQDSANTRKSKRSYGYVLECKVGGEPRTVEGFGQTESTYHETSLIAINKALKRLNQSCLVHIHTEDRFVLNMLENNLERWAGNDFKTTKGKPVESETEWRKLWEHQKKQILIPEHGAHQYENWIQGELKNEKHTRRFE